jgi:putative membrane protein
MAVHLSEIDKDMIAAAVAEAEARTSGELLCVLTEEVSDYREVPLAWATGVALLLPPVLFVLGAQPLSLAEALGGWSVAHSPAAESRLGLVLTLYAAAQAALFVAVALICSAPAIRRRLTPASLKARRVHRAALQHFLGASAHLAPDQPAVLIFASVEDRRMEIVAHEAIHAQVGRQAWDQVVADALAETRRSGPGEGLVRAVHLCGMLLAQHFPDDGRANAFPDRPVEV